MGENWKNSINQSGHTSPRPRKIGCFNYGFPGGGEGARAGRRKLTHRNGNPRIYLRRRSYFLLQEVLKVRANNKICRRAQRVNGLVFPINNVQNRILPGSPVLRAFRRGEEDGRRRARRICPGNSAASVIVTNFFRNFSANFAPPQIYLNISDPSSNCSRNSAHFRRISHIFSKFSRTFNSKWQGILLLYSVGQQR